MINVDKILGQILGAGRAIDGKPFDGKSLAGGLLVGGLAGVMTGKTGKKVASTALKLGGAAAVAGLAYSAYQRYRAGAPGASTVPGTLEAPPRAIGQHRAAPEPLAGPWGAREEDVIDVAPLEEAHFLPHERAETENLSLKLIRAMIAAAKADGQIDGSETDRIIAHVDRLGLSAEERSFLLGEINRPWTARDIAASAAGPEEAAELYAVSVMAVNPNGLAERLYIGELARCLKLDQALAKSIHDRVVNPT